MAYVPIIDFSPFLDPSSTDENKKKTALEIDKACREIGFFYLSNHGVDEELRAAMLSRAKSFFENATEEEKKSISIKPAGTENGDDARGFQKVDGRGKGAHEVVDFFRPVETSTPPYETGLGQNLWPSTPNDFREVSEKYIDALFALATKVVQALALGLSVDESIFMSRIGKAFWNLRVLGYYPKPEGSVVGIGDHTDFGILTFLLTDPQKDSLLVLSKDGNWEPADPIPNCFLCNIGDMLSKWTDGIYKSTRHRVLHNSDTMRISVPFFFDPDWDAVISPVLPLDVEHREDEGILYREKFVKAIKYSVVT
ncbi:Clavaminate synthase-like protein [Mollisia scopiformis]|uniref:Clavaminate synthase-like protein n=1 Tax=Mollisia scopiformis TaxID=149040 RepID=A0A194XAA3_MOLSC|nr:Clavaminate synthase-like protein [Mollisia scopiformis]KUJ17103.1 Clavaminate synthase-like protein [Mollisia scopiformis]